MIRRISAKKLASLGGKVPWSSITGKRKAVRRERPELTHRKAPDPWPAISKRIRLKWWNEQYGQLRCGICGGRIYLWEDLVPDHIQPGKMGGCKDHSESNLQPAHSRCNLQKGSRRNFTISGGQDGN